MKRMKKILAGFMMVFSLVLAVPGNLPGMQMTVTAEAATVKLNKSKATLEKGKTMKLKVTGTKKKVKWSSSNKKVATVSSTGKVTAKKRGTVTITAKVNGVPYKCKITVTVPKLSEKKVTLSVGSTHTLKVTGTTKKVAWSSDNQSVVTVNSKGELTAKKEGTAIITATVSGKRYTCKVTVKKTVQKTEVKTETEEKEETERIVEAEYSSSNSIILTMAACGIREASLTAQFSSSLQIDRICYEKNVIINGKKADRMVIQCTLQNSFEGSRQFYVVVTGSDANLLCENTVKVNGSYVSCVTVTKDPGMKGTVLSTSIAMKAYQSIFSVNVSF